MNSILHRSPVVLPARPALLLILAFLALPGALGCDVFDAQLYLDRDAATSDSGAGDSSAADSGETDSGETDSAVELVPVPLSDTCASTPPVVSSALDPIFVDTTGLGDQASQVGTCTGGPAPGNDGFFSVEMLAGERWHFHATARETVGDPVIYILDPSVSCDERSCARGAGANYCNRQDEHFTYVAPRDGTYHVAVDDADERGGTYTVLAVRPTCGNGLPLEHSETCEGESATCTAECAAIVPSGGSEAEPNDDVVGANVLDFTSGRIRGNVASQCDLGSFRFTAPAGATLTAGVYGRGDSMCDVDGRRPAVDLELLPADGLDLLGSVSAAAGDCPVITGTEGFATGLAAGDYVLRIRPTGVEATNYDFDLVIDVAVP